MTWYPVQAALKMSTIPGAIRATLDTLLDHINPDPQDPRQPDSLTVWESRERLAAETGFSEITIKDHLKRLCGTVDLRQGQRVRVLTRVEEASSHRAARYELVPEALDALADRERRKAFEQGHYQPTHPYQRWLTWLEARHTSPAELGESSFPQDPEDESLPVSSFPQAEAVGESAFPQLGKAPSPEFPVVDKKEKQELTTVKAPVAIAPQEDKAEKQNPFWCEDCGYAIPSCPHRIRYREEIRADGITPHARR